MSISFERPVGAAADLSELEYVSALHQTQPGLVRSDGSVRDIDIVHFLRSRYGLKVDAATVRETILLGLGGDFYGGERRKDGEKDGDGDGVSNEQWVENEADAKGAADDDGDDEEEEVEGIDLAEMVAVLLIPTLLKSSKRDHPAALQPGPGTGEKHTHRASIETVETGGGEQGAGLIDGGGHDGEGKGLLDSLLPDEGLIAEVLGILLRNSTGSSNPDRPPVLTTALMRDLLVSYGEEGLASDEGLLEEMVKAASPPELSEGGKEESPLFDAAALARGLTHDVLLYNTANEVRLSSNYEDVLMVGAGGAPADVTQRHQLGPQVAEITAAEDAEGDEFLEEESVDGAEDRAKADPEAKERLKLTFDAASLDFSADQYMSKTLAVLLWSGFVMFYAAHGGRWLKELQILLNTDEDRTKAAHNSCIEEWESLQPYPSATRRFHDCFGEFLTSTIVNPELIECQEGTDGLHAQSGNLSYSGFIHLLF